MPINISIISDFYFCPRRFFLRNLEQQTKPINEIMIEGTYQHKAVDTFKIETRHDTVKVTAFHIYSKLLDLTGICDTIYFYRNPLGTCINFLKDKFIIEPVEYKHGKVREEKSYELQLTAQVMCLEEMFNTSISSAYIYYQNANTKIEVPITQELRQKVINIIDNIKKSLNSLSTIAPVYKKRCKYCSMYDICNPRQFAINKYMESIRKELLCYEADSENSICNQ